MADDRHTKSRSATKRVLGDHKQRRRSLIPPLMQFAPLTEQSWHNDMLPDFLWVALMLGQRSDWKAAYSALDVLDRFVPEGPRVLDGRITSFALVPNEQRSAAREALCREAPHALPSAFGHVLGLYPDCPARWLYADWLEHHEPEAEIGLPLIRSLVHQHTDKRGVSETRLRMVAIARRVVHGKISHTGTGAFALAPRYPTGLTESEQAHVESIMRAAWASINGADVERHSEVADWPREFWRHNRELVRCSIPDQPEREVIDMGQKDGPVHAEPSMLLSEMRAVLTALDALGEKLRRVQLDAQREPQADEGTVVLFGLASRLYRLLYAFIERPSAWAPATAFLHLRPILDARILSAWLMHRNDPIIIAAYREHGLGRLKLLRAHIEADLGEGPDAEAREMLDSLDARVNLERDEWAQPVNLGSFADVTVRQMAIETNLKREYDLGYAPYSSESHGEWTTVRDNDTVVCNEPLHRGHRVGTFGAPSHTVGPQPVVAAFDFVRDGISAVFEHLGLDVEADFEPLDDALHAALYEAPDEAGGEASA